MYIRRKVFSIAIDENGEEKLFSTTELVDEDSYIEKLYSENPEQKEFTSVRGAKKIAKATLDAVYEGNRKELGKIIARANRRGLTKNSEKLLNSKGFDKVANSSANHVWRKAGDKGLAPKEFKDMFRENSRNEGAAIGKRNIAAGNKLSKLPKEF